jgi:hypothetical protein
MRRATAVFLFAAVPALAGSVRGRVTLSGKAPVLPATAVRQDPRTCGATQEDESLIVSARGGIKNAVVFLEGAARTPPPPDAGEAVIDQIACRYLPHVQAVRVGARLVTANSDPILHTIRATVDGGTLFNVAMPIQGMRKAFALTQPGLIRAACDAGHTWMLAWVYAFDHPYFAVTSDDGSFEIRGVPPGKYRLHSWQERLGTQEQEIHVKGDAAAQAAFTYRSP